MIDSLYFDHHTVARPFPEVLEKFFRLSKEYWASSASSHFLGQQQSYLLQKSRERLVQELGASEEDEVFFTSSGEESVYQVFFQFIWNKREKAGKPFFLSQKQKKSRW